MDDLEQKKQRTVKWENESNIRKHLLKTLRPSIEVQGQADTKRRKCLKAEPNPKNSREGEDHIKSNRDTQVEALNHDLQGNRINKWESQSIMNLMNAGKQR